MGFGRNNRIEKKGKKKRRKVATDKKSQKDGLSVNRCWSNLWIMQPVILNARYQKKEFPEAYQKKVSLIANRKEIPVKKHQLNYTTSQRG